MIKLIILDRDGVINYDSKEYIKSPAEWHPIPGSIEAIAKLTQAGYQIAIATNQSGIGRGLFDEKTLAQIHAKMLALIEQQGGRVGAIFYCPHLPEENCSCRKPKPGLFYAIARHFDCSLNNVPAIGDSQRDLDAALQAGCKPILVQSGVQTVPVDQNIAVFANLAQAVDGILTQSI